MTNVPGRKYFKGEQIYTDWMPRGGDGVILRAENIDQGGSQTPQMALKIEIFEKNSEDTGDGSAVPGGAGLLTLGSGDNRKQIVLKPTSTAGLKEQVRLKITTSGGAEGDWMQARIFPLVFFDGARS